MEAHCHRPWPQADHAPGTWLSTEPRTHFLIGDCFLKTHLSRRATRIRRRLFLWYSDGVGMGGDFSPQKGRRANHSEHLPHQRVQDHQALAIKHKLNFAYPQNARSQPAPPRPIGIPSPRRRPDWFHPKPARGAVLFTLVPLISMTTYPFDRLLVPETYLVLFFALGRLVATVVFVTASGSLAGKLSSRPSVNSSLSSAREAFCSF